MPRLARIPRLLFAGALATTGCTADNALVVDGGFGAMDSPPQPWPDDAHAGGDQGAPCANSTISCGPPGQCADCTNSVAGIACVDRACGCNGVTDCPPGAACDPGSHRCSPECADKGAGPLPCNSGCCDGARCSAGTTGPACGRGGGRCATCAAGTPTCDNGACAATCAVGGVGGAACGDGFCCGAMNTCVKVDDASCGARGSACTDCRNSQSGPICDPNSGQCGCKVAGDCGPGQACRLGACSAACDDLSPCNGGCCAVLGGGGQPPKGTCAPGAAHDACGGGGGWCADCRADPKGRACRMGMGPPSCGCNTAAECPKGQACNTQTHVCGVACDANTPCNEGCCTAAQNGQCVPGTAQASCGDNGATCANCVTQAMQGKSGSQCIALAGGGQCGCNGNGDCPMNSAGCVNKQCNFVCGANQPCLVGCCAIPVGQMAGACAAGTGDALCGAGGATCVDCARAQAGHVCLPGSGKCGCNVAADCPVGTACHTGSHACENVCGDMNHTACNGGCCGAGRCVGGGAANACGGGGGACANCAASMRGRACVVGLMGPACGCNVAADCPTGTACNTATHACEVACGDNGHSDCNGGCCNVPQGMMVGSCVAGTQNSACGRNGRCAACTNGTPTCAAGVCSAACGVVGNGTCAGGFCCRANQCVDGRRASTCGYSGVCADCTNAMAGHACITGAPQGPWICGCNLAGDCTAANVPANVGGQACDTIVHGCTNTCGVNGVTTACNGGCCQIAGGMGTCRAGTQSGACGGNGGLCSNCQAGCGGGQAGVCRNQACGCCVANGQVCNGNGQCCSGACQGGRCACIASGQACAGGNPALCCAGQFLQPNTCGGNNNVCCLPSNSICTQNGACCSGSCNNFLCR